MRSGNRICVMLLAAAVAIFAGTALATPVGFTEYFSGPTLDPAWVQGGGAGGTHYGIISGLYYMEAAQGGTGNPKLSRFDTGDADPLLPYTHEISAVLSPFAQTGGGGTQSDFKFKGFGPDGNLEVILNSFGDLKFVQGGGVGEVYKENIGYADGQVLHLALTYNPGTDTVDITYALDAGAPVAFYSGPGGAPIGDRISNFVEIEVFKWGTVDLDNKPLVGIDEWNLTVIPEPSMIALFGLGGLALMASRRRK